MTQEERLSEIYSSPDLVEVMDASNRPIAVMSRDAAHRQMLPHRSVQVLIFNTERKLYLQKRTAAKTLYPGRWDISARTHPRVGESSLDAALRVLYDELQLDLENLQYIKTLPACPETGFEFVALYSASRVALTIVPNMEDIAEGYSFSREELNCLVKEFRELLTPNLVMLWEAGLLFPL